MKNKALENRQLQENFIDMLRNDGAFRLAVMQELLAIKIENPVEPWYSLKVAAMLIPCSYATITTKLSKWKHIRAVYRNAANGKRLRMITASDIVALRESSIAKGFVHNRSSEYRSKHSREAGLASDTVKKTL